MKKILCFIFILSHFSLLNLAVASPTSENSLTLAKALKLNEFAVIGIKLSFKQNGACLGERKPACDKFFSLLQKDKLTDIAAGLIEDGLSELEIADVVEYFKNGTGNKDIANAILSMNKMLDPSLADAPLLYNDQEKSIRSKFNASNTGVKFNQFSQELNQKYAVAFKPYIIKAAQSAGLMI